MIRTRVAQWVKDLCDDAAGGSRDCRTDVKSARLKATLAYGTFTKSIGGGVTSTIRLAKVREGNKVLGNV